MTKLNNSFNFTIELNEQVTISTGTNYLGYSFQGLGRLQNL